MFRRNATILRPAAREEVGVRSYSFAWIPVVTPRGVPAAEEIVSESEKLFKSRIVPSGMTPVTAAWTVSSPSVTESVRETAGSPVWDRGVTATESSGRWNMAS